MEYAAHGRLDAGERFGRLAGGRPARRSQNPPRPSTRPSCKTALDAGPACRGRGRRPSRRSRRRTARHCRTLTTGTLRSEQLPRTRVAGRDDRRGRGARSPRLARASSTGGSSRTASWAWRRSRSPGCRPTSGPVAACRGSCRPCSTGHRSGRRPVAVQVPPGVTGPRLSRWRDEARPGRPTGGKWDRAARYLRVAMILHGHPDGISAADIAEQVGISKRTAYRDLEAMSARRRPAHLAGRWPLGCSRVAPSCHRST